MPSAPPAVLAARASLSGPARSASLSGRVLTSRHARRRWWSASPRVADRSGHAASQARSPDDLAHAHLEGDAAPLGVSLRRVDPLVVRRRILDPFTRQRSHQMCSGWQTRRARTADPCRRDGARARRSSREHPSPNHCQGLGDKPNGRPTVSMNCRSRASRRWPAIALRRNHGAPAKCLGWKRRCSTPQPPDRAVVR